MGSGKWANGADAPFFRSCTPGPEAAIGTYEPIIFMVEKGMNVADWWDSTPNKDAPSCPWLSRVRAYLDAAVVG